MTINPKVKERVQHTFTFPSFRCARIQFAAFVSVVSSPVLVSGCKVITLKPINQTICGKSCVKNSFVKIRRRFWRVSLLSACVPKI